MIGLGACGFRLRGTELQALQNIDVHIQSSQANIISAAVTRQLRDIGLKQSATTAKYTVRLSNESFIGSVVSISATTGKVEEYELEFKVILTIKNPDGSLVVDSEPLVASRDYIFGQTDALSKFEEESALRQDIARQVAATIVRRLLAVIRQ